MHSLLVALTVAGWLLIVFTIPGIVVGIFFVLGTAEPWWLVIPLLAAAGFWCLTRLDFKEKTWIKSAGILITGLAASAVFTLCLIVSRNNSLPLVLWGILPAAFIGLGGVIMIILSPENRKSGQRRLNRLSSRV
jgi:hypothetical protein